MSPPAVRPGPVLLFLAAAGTVAALVIDLRVPGAHRAALSIEPGATGGVPGVALAWGASVLLGQDPRHRLGWVLGVFGVWWAFDGLAASWVTYATLADPPLPGASAAFFVYQRLGAWLLLAIPLVLLLYPDGRLPAGRGRVLALASLVTTSALPLTLVAVPAVIAEAGSGAGELPAELAGVDLDLATLPLPDAFWSAALRAAFLVLPVSLVPVLAIVVRRYLASTGIDRVRMRWLLWAAVVDVLVMLTIQLLPYGSGSIGLTLAVVLTVAAVVTGSSRPRVVDVDRLLGGTLVYAALLAATLLIDVVVLTAAGWLLGDRLDSDQTLVLAVFVVAAAYAPLRHRLWRLARTRVLGQPETPYAVVAGLAQRLEESPDPDAQLLEVARAVAVTFRTSYVGVELRRTTGEVRVVEHGSRPGETQALPVSYRGEQVGRLLLPVHGVAGRLGGHDERLLADVVRQAAAAARADQLARDLQQSRERLVTAVEDERRRLRRELHDGLGPTLAAVASRVDTARITALRDPEGSDRMLAAAREEVTGMLAEVRRLVHGLRPPALDDVGLVHAVRQTAERLAPPGLEVSVTTTGDLSGLPAAVEVAAYRISAEALTNVVRHARAHSCSVTLALADPDAEADADAAADVAADPDARAGGRGALVVWVVDDGTGIAPDVRAGVGLLSLRERAEELGGRVEVAAGPERGTVVVATLPLGYAPRPDGRDGLDRDGGTPVVVGAPVPEGGR